MTNIIALVFLNIWAHVDSNGDPSTVIPSEGGSGLIGATAEQQKDGSVRIVYDKDPTPVESTAFTRRLAKSGGIFPADARSAALLGVPFVPVSEQLNAAKAKAIAEYDAQHGPGAWAALHPASAPTKKPTATS